MTIQRFRNRDLFNQGPLQSGPVIPEHGDSYAIGKLHLLADEKGTIDLIETRDEAKKIKTAKGIQVGSSRKEIISKYGDNYYTYTGEQVGNSFGYVDQKQKVYLEFALDDHDKVYHIQLGDLEKYPDAD
ncbi:hypothetical protein ACFOUO_04940 [Salinithrix halophila]|uniref:Uncharacterized protein n=1 Tax=Salinithrix halophila TaxID=1485204 RepID=A0ABV8JH80_9BACL